jgi:hypothetical protein
VDVAHGALGVADDEEAPPVVDAALEAVAGALGVQRKKPI